jgi:hypothetical protein
MKILKRHKNKIENIRTISTTPKIRKLETTVLIKEVSKKRKHEKFSKNQGTDL